MSRRARRWLVALLALVLVLGAVRAALPFATERLLERLLSDLLYARLEVGNVDLDLLEGEIVAHFVAMRSARDDLELARARRVALDVDWGALLRGSLEAERLAVARPEVTVEFDGEGRLNWGGVGGPPKEPNAGSEPAGQFAVEVARLEIGAGLLRLVDEVDGGLPNLTLALGAVLLEGAEIGRAEPGGALYWSLAGADASDWRLAVVPDQGQDLELEIRASTGAPRRDGTLPISFELRREAGLTVEVEGELRPSPLELSLDLTWKDLPSRALAGFLPIPGARVRSGESEAKLHVELTLADVPERGLTLSGALRHRDLGLDLERDLSAHLDVAHVALDVDHLSIPIPAGRVEPPPPLVARWSRIEVEAPVLEVRLPDVAAGAEAAGSGESEESEPFLVDAQVDELVLRDGHVRWSDPGQGADFELRIGSFTLGEAGIARIAPEGSLHWALESAAAAGWQLRVIPRDGGEAFDYTLTGSTLAIEQGGKIPLDVEVGRVGGMQIELKGDLRPDPLEATLGLRFREANTRRLALLLGLDGVRVERGVAQGSAEIDLTLAEGPQRGLRVRGELTHRELALVVEGDTGVHVEVGRFVGVLDELVVPMPAEAAAQPPGPIRVRLARVEIERPSVAVQLPDPALRNRADEGAAAEDGPALELDVRVASLVVREGRAVLRDPAIGAGAEQRLSAIALDAADVRWPELSFASARLLVGSLGAPPLRIEGSRSRSRADIEIRGGQIDLAPWNPLISSYSEYSVSSGSFSLRSDVAMRGDSYDAPTHVTTHNLAVSSRGDGFQRTFGMPLSVTLQLLTDTAGNIRLELPLSGNLREGSGLDLTTTIVAAMRDGIVNAIASAAAAPVDLVGGVFRRVGEAFVLGVGEVQFAPGTHALALGDELSLRSAAGLVSGTRRAQLVLQPQVVSDDLRAIGEAGEGENVLGQVVAVGRAIFGGSRSVDVGEHGRAAELARKRVDAMARFLEKNTALGRERIIAGEWDGRVREGRPRVVMRMRRPSD